VGQTFTFDRHDTFLVGRAEACHFRLRGKDPHISRAHLLIEVNPPWCLVIDLSSRNGTFVNGRRIRSARLRDSDEIRLGQTVLRVAVELAAAELPSTMTVESAAEAGPNASGKAEDPAGRSETSSRVAPSESDHRDGGLREGSPASQGRSAAGDPQQEPLRSVRGYQVLGEIGRGSRGVVFKARRETDGEVIALKMIQPAIPASAAELRRFIQEVSVLERLEHPHIVRFHRMGVSGGRLFFEMEYVSELNAARLLEQHNCPLPVSRAVNRICQVLEALEYAHAEGFIHRDIKPSNILVREDRGRDVIKLADFGLAMAYVSSSLSGLTIADELAGTLPYLAPEQITSFRAARPTADQYSAAATLYRLLTNEYVYDFPADVNEQLRLILDGHPVPLRTRRPDLPPALAAAVERALSRDPRKRFRDVRMMREALLPFVGQ
jgi:serine/threonine-protein kinase